MIGGVDDRLVLGAIALRRGALRGRGRDDFESLRLGVLGKGLAPVPKILRPGMNFHALGVADSDDHMGVDMASVSLVGVHAEHEFVLGELLMDEAAHGGSESVDVDAGLGGDDEVHRVARLERAQIPPPGARLGLDGARVVEEGAAIRNRRAALLEPRQAIDDARWSIAGRAGLEHDPMLTDAGRFLDAGLHSRFGFRREDAGLQNPRRRRPGAR